MVISVIVYVITGYIGSEEFSIIQSDYVLHKIYTVNFISTGLTVLTGLTCSFLKNLNAIFKFLIIDTIDVKLMKLYKMIIINCECGVSPDNFVK